jgi:diacylglycerol kinase family enzyme
MPPPSEVVDGIESSRVPIPQGSRTSRDVAIFANPIAGRGRGATTAKEIALSLQKRGYIPHLIFDHPARANLPNLPLHAAISIGGDGTLRTVVSNLSQKKYAPPPIVVVPTGTANLMGQSLGLDWSLPHLGDQVASALNTYRLVPRDVATANGRLFLIVAGAGLDGQIIHELERRRTGPISLLHYALPGALSLKSWHYPEITVTVDGQRIFGPAKGMAMVGNVREHGIGFSFLSKAHPDDGLLDILAFPCQNVFEGFEMLLHAAAGQMTEQEGVVYTTGKHCQITSPHPVPIQADGEAAGFTPLEVELLPFQVPFVVP